MSAFDFGFQELRAQRQAEKLFWGRGCALCVSISLLVPLFVLISNSLDSLATWQEDQEWYVMNPNKENPYICQRNTSCQSLGWTASAESGKCWKVFVDDPTTYPRAKQRCEQRSSTLAVILSETQNSEVHGICGESQPCWIGFLRPSEDSTEFSWVDGSPAKYTKWSDGEPEDSEDTVVIGMRRVHLAAAGLAVQDAVAQIFLMFVNIAIMTMVCGVVYQAMLAKNSSLLMCAVVSDGGCAFCCFMWVFLGVGNFLQGDRSVTTWLTMSLATLQLFTLVALCFFGIHFNENNLKVPPVSQVTIGEVGMGTTSSLGLGPGQVVIGRPVQAPGSPRGLPRTGYPKVGRKDMASTGAKSGAMAKGETLPMRTHEGSPDLE